MSRNIRGRIRTLFAVPSAAVLVLGATQALASPAPSARLPDCEEFCANTGEAYCAANPTYAPCRYCGFCPGW
jgi:hypothetical protein